MLPPCREYTNIPANCYNVPLSLHHVGSQLFFAGSEGANRKIVE